ncbi:MAG: phosphate/phosphite/phosphonate ABC transporter substrate-binding protein [Kordiimonadaceae bacterium]|nr:phosphate/phosphite/phosphonate ABC transporter substrate-binding protein [Kordiimonadaceae bacterium]
MLISSSIPTQAADKKLVLGRVSVRADMSLHGLKTMNSYLRTVLKDGENITFSEKVVPTLSEMVELVKTGDVDLVSETPMGMIALEKNAQANIILHEWKQGIAEYASLIIARADSSIEDVDDLVGKVIAFEDSGSTSGFLMPLAMLRKKGFKNALLQNRSEKPPAGSIGHVFATYEINIASLVARRLVDAGAISDLNWNDPLAVPPGFKKRLKIIHASALVPRAAVLVSKHMSADLKADLLQQFSLMHKSFAGREAMKTYHDVSLFTPITAELEAQFAELRDLHTFVKDEIK